MYLIVKKNFIPVIRPLTSPLPFRLKAHHYVNTSWVRNNDFFYYHVKYRERKRFIFEEDAAFHLETDDSGDGIDDDEQDGEDFEVESLS